MPEDPFQDLICQARNGDEAAIAEVVRLYSEDIRRVIRIRLRRSSLRRILDSQDIWQSVAMKFFAKLALGQFVLQTPEQLAKVWMTIATQRLTDKLRRERNRPGRSGGVPPGQEPASSDSSPLQHVAMEDLIQEIRRRLSPEDRDIADERARGRKWSEIGKELGRNPNSVRKQYTRAVDEIWSQLKLDN